MNNATLDIEVTLAFPGGTVQFGMKGVSPKIRINEIARAYADALPREGQIQETPDTPQEAPAESLQQAVQEAVQEQEREPVRKVIANEHIPYRNNSYLVQHYQLGGNDFYNIFNEAKVAPISPSSVTGRTILKLYRKEKNTEEEE